WQERARRDLPRRRRRTDSRKLRRIRVSDNCFLGHGGARVARPATGFFLPRIEAAGFRGIQGQDPAHLPGQAPWSRSLRHVPFGRHVFPFAAALTRGRDLDRRGGGQELPGGPEGGRARQHEEQNSHPPARGSGRWGLLSQRRQALELAERSGVADTEGLGGRRDRDRQQVTQTFVEAGRLKAEGGELMAMPNKQAFRGCLAVVAAILVCSLPLRAANRVVIVQTNSAGDRVSLIDPATN